MIRVLVVDDEVHARRGLQALLADESDVEVVGEARNGREAVDGILKLKPDLVFLDAEMPGLTGLQVIDEVGADAMPPVIFVTAYDQYAVAAFETNALDYLLKPFSAKRFRAALARARDSLRESGGDQGGTIERFAVRVGDELKVFRTDEIDWIEADDYYVKLHIGGHAHTVKQTMGALEDRLPGNFARIHRSSIVNLDRIVALEPIFQGDFTVLLRDGSRLRMSRRRRDLLGDRLPFLT